MKTICGYLSCNQEIAAGSQRYKGILFCASHYENMIITDFYNEYESWNNEDAPSERFRSLLGRINEEFWEEVGNSYLSKARIRDRTFNFKKTDAGCEFEITRHPGTWSGNYKKNIVQHWRVDFQQKIFELVSERDFQEGDYD